MHNCNQDKCNEPAAYRFTWPGKDEAGICEGHVPKLRAVACALGFHLQIIPIEPEERRHLHVVRDDEESGT